MKPGEEEEVCSLVSRAFDRFVAPDFTPDGVKEFYEYANPMAMSRRREAGDRILVAEKQGQILGMIELRGPDHIAMFFVDEPGQGVGRALVERALEVCREANPELQIVTVHASLYAIPIYRRLGFEAQGHEHRENGIAYLPMCFRWEGAD
jgi:GNAT superfamily N-acetyltransferase